MGPLGPPGAGSAGGAGGAGGVGGVGGAGGADGASGDCDTAARLRKKAALTVADVMRHEGGLAKVDHTFTFEELSLKGVQGNAVGRVLEGARQEWPAETTRQ